MWRNPCTTANTVRKVAHMTEPQQMALPGLTPQWTLGDRLRKARETAGLNQTQLADELEIARNSVGRYESGNYDPPRTVIIAWALRTGVDFGWLLGDHQTKRRGGYQDFDVTNADIPSGMSVDQTGPPTTAEILAHRKAFRLARTAVAS